VVPASQVHRPDPEHVRVFHSSGGKVGVGKVAGDLQLSEWDDLLAEAPFEFECPVSCRDCLFAAAGVKQRRNGDN
jgi:hypothetical protein